MEDLRLTIVQTHLKWEDRLANRQRLAALLDPLAGQTDLIILPEMFTTGFSMNAVELSEPMDGPTIAWLKERAQATGAVVTGSFIARAGQAYFNRLLWMQPDGTYEYYDKRHLFTLAQEQNTYSPGNRRLVATLQGWRILPLICYDLRFPAWSRNTVDFDLLLYVANWPERRNHAWKSLLIARAIENLSYTVGVNRIGEDGNGIVYSGDSSLIDYSGQLRYRVSYCEDVFTTTLSYQEQAEFRRKFAFLNDRDVFFIK